MSAGVDISLRIGQHVRHRDYKGQRVTGTLRGLSFDSDNVLTADIVLDAPIVLPARGEGDRQVDIWRQCVPAVELSPLDDRDELIAELLAPLQFCVQNDGGECLGDHPARLAAALAAIKKATGSAP